MRLWILAVLAIVQVADASPPRGWGVRSSERSAVAPSRTCPPSGGVLFSIDQRVDPKHKLVTAATRLFGNGSWQTRVIDVDGNVMRTSNGCLEPDHLDHVRSELRAAKWQVGHREPACGTKSPRFTVYRWAGKPIYTERVCSTEALDRDSANALDLIATLVRVPENLDGDSRPQR